MTPLTTLQQPATGSMLLVFSFPHVKLMPCHINQIEQPLPPLPQAIA